MTSASQKQGKILVVDDNIDSAQSLAMIMEINGHEVRTAYSGPEALEIANEMHPDIVFLDIGLPGMSGYEVAHELKQNAKLAEITLVALTGWSGDDDKEQTTRAGFAYHFTKPVDFADIEKFLEERLATR